MHLDLLSLLTERGHVTHSRILSGAFEIADVSKRNSNHRISWDDGQGYFAKRGTDQDRHKTVQQEARVYRYFAAHPELGEIRAAMPAYRDFIEEQGVMLLEFLGGAETLRGRMLRTGKVAKGPSIQIGRFLAELHARTSLDGPVPCLEAAKETRAPFGLTFDRPDRNILHSCSSGALELVKVVQGAQHLCRGLADLRADWQTECLVHGDLRWDNCLLVPAKQGGSGANALRIVDWELAVYGDAAWDIGAVLAEHVGFWLQSVPVIGPAPDEAQSYRDIACARFPLEAMKPSIQAFWRSYSDGRGLDQVDRNALLARSVRYSAGRLLQSSFEWSNVSPVVPVHAILLTQIAENVLRQPEAAGIKLYGLLEDVTPFACTP